MSSKENLKYAMSLLTMYQTELAMFKCFVPCLVPQSCPTLCDLTDYSPPGSSVLGILQARILEWVAIPGDLPDPGIEPAFLTSPAFVGGFFTTSATWEAQMNPYCSSPPPENGNFDLLFSNPSDS